jgi:plastocyanin
MRKATLIVIVLAVFAALMAACSSGSSGSPSAAAGSTSESTASSSPSESESEADVADVSGKKSLDVEADDFYFSPSTIRGTAGQQLTIKVENEGQATHTFTMESQNVDVEVEPGNEAEVNVTFPKSGSVEFICRFHASQGMTGELEVA